METHAEENRALPPSRADYVSAPEGGRWAELRVRLVSALALGTMVLIAVLLGGLLFTLVMVAAALLVLREWDALTAGEGRVWALAGLVYAAVPCALLLWLRGIVLPLQPHAGLSLTLSLIFMVIATDVGAYFAGRQFGGPKLAPRISPGKTWAGLAGGMAAAAAAGAACSTFSPYPATFGGGLAVGALLAAVAQGGDLFESWLKRRAGVKDSGALLPGHGGAMDRLDGYAAAIPVFALLAALFL